jgi:hypothetical protein
VAEATIDFAFQGKINAAEILNASKAGKLCSGQVTAAWSSFLNSSHSSSIGFSRNDRQAPSQDGLDLARPPRQRIRHEEAGSKIRGAGRAGTILIRAARQFYSRSGERGSADRQKTVADARRRENWTSL